MEELDVATGGKTAAGRCCNLDSIVKMEDWVADHLALALKALGHPIRIQMMNILSQLGGSVCVCDIESQFTIKQPTVSHHLRILREAGLIDAEQKGLFMFYKIRPEMVTFIRRQLEKLVR